MIDILRTDGGHPDFIELCRELDHNLDEIVGGSVQREKYGPYAEMSESLCMGKAIG